MIYVDVPQADGTLQRKLIWYMVYHVKNKGGITCPNARRTAPTTPWNRTRMSASSRCERLKPPQLAQTERLMAEAEAQAGQDLRALSLDGLKLVRTSPSSFRIVGATWVASTR